MIFDFLHKVKRKLMKLRLLPIRVFCFHQVSDSFDEESMHRVDWLSTEEFMRIVNDLRERGYTFISLPDAYKRLKHDVFRYKKYAVLTADDGYVSLFNILPWLNEQHIPITLFLNPAYLDGKHFRERNTEKYMTEQDVSNLYEHYPLLTLGMHGWEHKDATIQTEEEFIESVEKSEKYMNTLPNFIPYFAYTWGKYTKLTEKILMNKEIIPLTIKGGKNYNEYRIIDRELFNENIIN